ncbi:MAG: addiction module protein [Bacteroidota bacterium]|nr:addiction module protein [Bacteroidota bacterium]
MTVQQIEKQVLKLDANSRAKLASKLLSSLDELSDVENEKLWAEEAVHRHKELSSGKSKSAEVVFKNAQKK